MTATSGRTCVLLASLSLALVAALSIGLNARHQGATAPATIAQLQGGPPMDAGPVAATSDVSDKTAPCAQREASCRSPKQELALAVSDDRPSTESKTGPGDLQPEPRN
jgi:hypothetical protein